MKEFIWVVYLVIGYLAGWAVSVAYFRAKARAKEKRIADELAELLDELGVIEVPPAVEVPPGEWIIEPWAMVDVPDYGPIPAGQLEALGVCSYCLAVPGKTPECPRCADALKDGLKWEPPKVVEVIAVSDGKSIQEAIDAHDFQINGNGKIPFRGVRS